MGLPASRAASVLWCANEERVEDIKRRLKAASQHMGIRSGADIVVRGKTSGMLRLIALNEIGTPEIDRESVAKIVGWCRAHGAQVVILDPYVTLSDAMDENSATSAAMLTKAFLLISSLTGAAVIHAHHTPKDRNKDNDWYRADSGAWRGSGAIYSALDCGFTLANWMPAGGEPRKRWKQKFLEDELGRFIVLDTGKIREGRPLVPVVYELVGEELPRGLRSVYVRSAAQPRLRMCCSIQETMNIWPASWRIRYVRRWVPAHIRSRTSTARGYWGGL
jgi:hypothetical protein